MLAFVREAASEQLKQLPLVGPLMAGGLKVVQRLSDEDADREAAAMLDRLLVETQPTRVPPEVF